MPESDTISKAYVLHLLAIYTKTVEAQKARADTADMKMYLEGQLDACRLLSEQIKNL